jgi:hypothetical protein
LVNIVFSTDDPAEVIDLEANSNVAMDGFVRRGIETHRKRLFRVFRWTAHGVASRGITGRVTSSWRQPNNQRGSDDDK